MGKAGLKCSKLMRQVYRNGTPEKIHLKQMNFFKAYLVQYVLMQSSVIFTQNYTLKF